MIISKVFLVSCQRQGPWQVMTAVRTSARLIVSLLTLFESICIQHALSGVPIIRANAENSQLNAGVPCKLFDSAMLYCLYSLPEQPAIRMQGIDTVATFIKGG